jgi:hypothetical protein
VLPNTTRHSPAGKVARNRYLDVDICCSRDVSLRREGKVNKKTNLK